MVDSPLAHLVAVHPFWQHMTDPRVTHNLPHSGTFNNNSVAISCGYTGFSQIYTAEAAENLNALGDYFRCSLQDVSRGTKMVVTGIGAVLTVHFINHGLTPRCTADLEAKASIGLKKLYWYWCFK